MESDHVWDHDLELELLTSLFVLWYGTMLKAVHTLTVHVFGLGPVPLDDPAIKRMVLQARAAAVHVDQATQKAISERIAKGAYMGLTPYQIAYGTEDFPGINGLFDETWRSRPLTVARTELQKAQLAATVDRFRQLGRGVVDRVRARDGDFDAACAARNGQTYPISNPPGLLHPNCRLTLSPVFTGMP
jgi:hypothetical protein